MRKSWFVKATTAVAVCMLAVTACGAKDDDSSRNEEPSSAIPTSSPTSPSAAEASRAAKAEADMEREIAAIQRAIEKAAQAKVDAIEKVVKTKSSPDDQQKVIITDYCHIQFMVNPTDADEATLRGLAILYVKYWRAGKWNFPLRSAAEQPGACPQEVLELPQTGYAG